MKKKLKKTFKVFSGLIEKFSSRVVNCFIEKEIIEEKVRNEMKWSEQENWQYLQKQIDYLNSRSAAITTHISIMIAVSLVALQITSGNIIEQTIILFEIVFYILVAILSLRNLLPVNVYAKLENHGAYLRFFEEDVASRIGNATFCTIASIFLTVVLTLSFIAHILVFQFLF